eukprot:1166452-Amphidinium_carterae.1
MGIQVDYVLCHYLAKGRCVHQSCTCWCARALPLYRKKHNPQVVQAMVCAKVMFHPIAEAHTCRFLGKMKLPANLYERAASIRLEPCARIQLLMRCARILPPPPVKLKRCQEYFLSPP